MSQTKSLSSSQSLKKSQQNIKQERQDEKADNEEQFIEQQQYQNNDQDDGSYSSYNYIQQQEQNDQNGSQNLSSSQNLSQKSQNKQSSKKLSNAFNTAGYYQNDLDNQQADQNEDDRESVFSQKSKQSISKSVNQQVNNIQDKYEEIVLTCNIHRQQIVKVCSKKNCKEKMLFCLECIEEFAEHVVKHRPFMSINDFLKELQTNPHTQRKEKIEMLQNENQSHVQMFLQAINKEKNRVAQKVIPVIKSALVGLCDQLQSRIFDEIDQFSKTYQYNSQFLNSYLDQNGLLSEILDQVPSYANLYQKFQENKGLQEIRFHDYLEKVYRKTLNNSSVEQTNQAFAYFEEVFEEFRKQGNNTPIFNGEALLLEKVEQVFNEFIDQKDIRYSSVISQYPICSSCSKEIQNDSNLQKMKQKLIDLQDQLSQLSKQTINQNNLQSTPQSTKKQGQLSQQSFQSKLSSQQLNTKSGQQLLNSKTEEIKQLQQEIDKISKQKPGSCKGCRRLYCISCQNQSYCKGCKLYFTSQLKTNKFIIKENKDWPMLMLDDTQKQGIQSNLDIPKIQNVKLVQISALLQKLNIGLVLANQELFSGKYEWEVVIENNDQCHSIGFGLCKLDELQSEIELGKNLKEFSESTGLIVVTSNGKIAGGLKGRVQSFQKEKLAMSFNCLLDFGKNKFSISGKNVYLEKDLENNQGYVPCFYSGCCFKSYNNFTIKQKYQYDQLIIQK
ncbi:hypothetical protein TTHERM_00390070 (macronuclear) [Tetrahymena thermophila SB210]|uniref:Uncharacterized protein n=1 Tax=Tetrahymena thermophila (strain SB210) TaxID=312017 RepID=Q23R81_TETTS|nr:hypothetical protein TTHERM_00390070 [Tetrahymena thermophila SB210]EAR99167.1 hypothetical protein TTHERM_00390070 [Tetrahymena thermophila SB210]|eukprot:XP_001019412.1 hypothetical protein TTHERM_00390070 [Tetrahymena thermophila SB210]